MTNENSHNEETGHYTNQRLSNMALVCTKVCNFLRKTDMLSLKLQLHYILQDKTCHLELLDLNLKPWAMHL